MEVKMTERLVYIDVAKGIGMSMIVWMHIWGNNTFGFTPPYLQIVLLPLYMYLFSLCCLVS